ncbi:PadR family transcriptional regulator [bacterium]|nr:PadR family transcriptional regulator [bacterium]
MIDILILHVLNKSVLTMYGISKNIKQEFIAFTLPSYGTISPAIKRLIKDGAINYQKTISEGGRRSNYYSISEKGKKILKNLLLAPISENPGQFLTNARLRLCCAEILNKEELFELTKILKYKAEIIMQDTDRVVRSTNNFYKKIVYDNLSCEYKNLISLIEGTERAGNN